MKNLLVAVGSSILAAIPIITVILLFTIPQFQNKIVEHKKKSVQIAVESAYNTLDFYYQKEKNHEISREEAQKLASDVIKNLRYQGKEYFWINDEKPKMIMHPFKPELNGHDIGGIADPHGKKIFTEMVQVTQKDGQGFVDYMWPKPDQKDPSPKTSFVKAFTPWGWIIGSGVYSDDIIIEINQIRGENAKWLGLATVIAILISLCSGMRQLIKIIIPVQEIILSLSSESNLLSSSAEELSTASQQLSSTGKTQSSSVYQTAAAMTEMNEMIQKTSESAQNSSALSEKTRLASQEGLRALEQLTRAMSDISNAQKVSEEVLENNLKKLYNVTHIVSKVSDKTKVINDIVFQTKLLSFNASVEAARAGEYGKGFSVVAEEVGHLARVSGASAKEITQIVDDSNRQVIELADLIKKDLTKVISDIQIHVREATTHASTSLQTLNIVLNLATEASGLSKNISAANFEQSKGSEEATQALRVMETTSQQMETVVINTEKEAKNLLEQARHLQQITVNLESIVGEKKKAA